MVPVSAGPLVEGGGACRTVLVAEPGRARHVVVGHYRRLHWLQCLVRSITSVFVSMTQ